MTEACALRQAGAALITVLMIVAAMSVVALGVTRSVLGATERARALDSQAQLRYFATAAEDVAKVRLYDIFAASKGQLRRDMPGYGVPQTFPVDRGAFVVTVRDGANCFDLNSLVSQEENGDLVGDASKKGQFERLLSAPEYEVFSANALSTAVIDWMDSDSIAGVNGAEDAYYLSMNPSYRTPGQRLSSVQELRAIRGFDAEMVRALQPLLCARPGRAQSGSTGLNINTLELHHAPLLWLALPDAFSLEDAQTVIANRPLGGWSDLAAFQQEPTLNRIDPAQIKAAHIGVQTSLVEVQVDVYYQGYMIRKRFLFRILPGEPVRTLQRQRVG